MNREWALYVDRIRRGRWLVLALGLAAAIVGFGVAEMSPPTYTGWATLTSGTASRAPEQDGVLASGYVDYFNRGAYQEKLKASQQIPADVTLEASTAAASPLIYVEATSTSLDEAVSGAASAAQAFRDDVNGQLRVSQDQSIAAMRKPIDDALAANIPVSEVALDQLQDRINQINGDTSNKLVSLQLHSGATERHLNAWLTTVLALLAGLVVGCLVAVGLSIVSRRLPTAGEVTAKIGTSPIAHLPAERSAKGKRLRDTRSQQLVNHVFLNGNPSRVTVTSTTASIGSVEVARAVAQGRAAQGVRTALVLTDMRTHTARGFGDIIANTSIQLDSVLTETSVPNLLEITSGRALDCPSASITQERVNSLLDRLSDRVECVVIAAPAVTEAAEGQILSAAADVVLLVIDSAASRVSDTAEALRLLDGVNSKLAGTVLITTDGRHIGDRHVSTLEPGLPAIAGDASESGDGLADRVFAMQNHGNGNGSAPSGPQRAHDVR